MLSYLVLSTLLQLCYVVNSLPADSPHHTTRYYVFNKLRNAYNFMFQKETIKTTHEDDYEYTTFEALNRFCDIMNGQFILNKTWSEILDNKTLPADQFYYKNSAENTKNNRYIITEDPILMRINPELARKSKADAEKRMEEKRIAEQEEVSRRNHYRSRKMSSEECDDSDEGIFQKIPFLGKILQKYNFEDKIVGGLLNTFRKTFIKSAQGAMGKDVDISETFKEELSQKAKQVGHKGKNSLGNVKDTLVEGMSKVAGAVGRKIGQLFAHYRHGPQLSRDGTPST